MNPIVAITVTYPDGSTETWSGAGQCQAETNATPGPSGNALLADADRFRMVSAHLRIGEAP